ncbi:MAG: hypothetical protein CSA15_01240 [Candidatus Delongbacteria bacterium]|nr:MAG: hypothetical protein CSA15_01240 [Candidatus Delongbacteria bacterium]
MELCPCGSKLEYKNCCKEIISGTKLGETPESVMRARYSAYVKCELDFLKESMDPEIRDQFDSENVEAWSKQSNWQKLEIISSDEDSRNEGHVEFKAFYNNGEKDVVHHEYSTFKKRDKWYFYSGKEILEPIRNESPKVKRNDPCPCGSGKKYKKCCG